MGGNPPIGYEVDNKKLLVNKSDAKIARQIFERYLEFGCVSKLKKYLDAHTITSKRRVSKRGNEVGGNPFSRGLYIHFFKIRSISAKSGTRPKNMRARTRQSFLRKSGIKCKAGYNHKRRRSAVIKKRRMKIY